MADSDGPSPSHSKSEAARLQVRPAGHAARIALALLLALVTYVSFPATPVVDLPVFEVGSVATQHVISPIAFQVPKDARELGLEQQEAARGVIPVFNFIPGGADSSLALTRQFIATVTTAVQDAAPGLTAAAVRAATDTFGLRLKAAEQMFLADAGQRGALAQNLERAITRILAAGVAPTGAMDTVRGTVTVMHGDTARNVSADSIVTFPPFVSRALALAARDRVGDPLMQQLLTTFFRPTIVFDRSATEMRRDLAMAAVPVHRFEVKPQEAIVRANEVIGPIEYEKLRALREELQNRQAGQRNIGRVAGAVLFNALFVGAFGLALLMFRPAIYGSFRSLFAMTAVFAIVVVAAAFVSRAPIMRPELIPIAVVAIVVSVLFDSRISMIAVMTLAVLIGGQSVFHNTNAQFLNMIAGVAAVFSVRLMRQRNQAYYSMISIALAYALAAVAHGLTLDRPVVDVLQSVLYGGVNAVITVPFALLVLPLAEEFTGIDTYPRLLEWSDLNRPLMRQMSLEAPGTYAHTMTIANLAEAACNAVGANGMLARVGAYYHDIGKLTAPHYFVENQARGRNPHDQIEPNQSAFIIRNHVTGGLELAQKHKLPRTLRAFINEHHGTGPITYFLEKSTELEGPPVNPEEFRYPGPIPQSIETAVVMLADAAEAAARVLNDPTPQKLREVVNHIIKLRMEQGQLADAQLTMKQLEIVKDEFTRVLSAAHHSRIDYPVSAGGITAEFAS